MLHNTTMQSNTVLSYVSAKCYWIERLSSFFGTNVETCASRCWVISHFILEVKHYTEMLCRCSSDYNEPWPPWPNSRSRFHVWGNPCHSLYHLTDRCQRNQRQPIMLIPPVIMCDDPAVTRSCGKYVRQYHRRRQIPAYPCPCLPPAPTSLLPSPSSSLLLTPSFLYELLPFLLISPLSLSPPGYCMSNCLDISLWPFWPTFLLECHF